MFLVNPDLLVCLSRNDTQRLRCFLFHPTIYTNPFALQHRFLTMKDTSNIGILVFWILGPITLVACVTLILLRLFRSKNHNSTKPVPLRRVTGHQLEYPSTSEPVANSWPDPESQIPGPRVVVRETSNRISEEPLVETPLAAWKPPGVGHLDWSLPTQRGPSPRQC